MSKILNGDKPVSTTASHASASQVMWSDILQTFIVIFETKRYPVSLAINYFSFLTGTKKRFRLLLLP